VAVEAEAVGDALILRVAAIAVAVARDLAVRRRDLARRQELRERRAREREEKDEAGRREGDDAPHRMGPAPCFTAK
jgi:hypothetical protein